MNDDSKNDAENLSFMKDMYRLRVKTTLVSLQDMSFKNFLDEYIKTDFEITPLSLLRNAVFDIVLATEYGMRNKDVELIKLIDRLVTKLKLEEGEDSMFAILFARLLQKTKNICEAGIPIEKIFNTFEFNDILKIFKENFNGADNHKTDKELKEFFKIHHYSNN